MRATFTKTVFKKVFLLPMILWVIVSHFFLLIEGIAAFQQTGEKIIYSIDLLGQSEYNDLGIVNFQGRNLRLVTFRTHVFGFDDTEKIYIDISSFLPVRVERNITIGFKKEYLVEEYDQKKYTLKVSKFKGNKKVKEYVFKKEGPIHNAVYLPFYLRTIPEPAAGWSFEARFPDSFKIKFVSLEEITVPAGKFKAYHFTSTPHKFDIWISKDNLRVPLKIKGAGALSYTMQMKSHALK